MIRSMIETSLVDWDGKLTTVLFFDKCNFMCPFCQNWELLLHPERFPPIDWSQIKKTLLPKKSWIDGVVLTGGEPLVYETEIFDICRKITNLEFLVKIDTNGAYPGTLQELIGKDLVDYVAMDIKAPLDDRYDQAAGTKVDLQAIKRSVQILKDAKIDYEFRTTCVPGIINEQTIAEIGEQIKEAKRWFLQQYVPVNAYKKEYRDLHAIPSPITNKLLRIAEKFAAEVKWRGKEI